MNETCNFMEYKDIFLFVLISRAKKELDTNLSTSEDWADFIKKLDSQKLIQAPFCGEIPCEDNIKKDSAR